MAYNYAKEKRKFDAERKRKALWYRKEGMSEEDIEAMRCFDLAQFNRDRAYETYYIKAPEADTRRYSWIDEISDPRLVKRLHELSEADLELLTLIVVDGETYRKVAERLSCSHQNISRHIARIRKILS